jgi:gamma-glutamylcyclotransferase (GGCT)/AIG2-like uncharacterized protein YtfP
MAGSGESVRAAASPGDSPRRLFVYGSLRAGEENPMAALLHRHARHLGEGTIHAGLYAISWYSGAAPCEDAAAVVHGDVFELHPETADRVMAELDAYEGSEFALRAVEVTLADETRVGAMAYLFAASVAGLRRIEHGDWRRERGAAGPVPTGAVE